MRKSALKTHKKAKEVGKQFIAALEAYLEAITPFTMRLTVPPESPVELLQQDVEAGPRWCEEVEKSLDTVRDVVHRLQQIVDYTPYPIRDPGKQRGRQEKKGINVAIVEIKKIFRGCVSSDNKALIHMHSLLYAAGIWPDPNPSGLIAKTFQLERYLPYKN